MDARQKYISELKSFLAPLTAEERTDALDFYNEYIEDAGYDNYQQIIKELGNPRQLSHKILADYSIKANNEEIKNSHTASPRFQLAGLLVSSYCNYYITNYVCVESGSVNRSYLCSGSCLWGQCGNIRIPSWLDFW